MRTTRWVYALIPLLLWTATVWADGGVTFQNIADNGGAGIDYERVPSYRFGLIDDIIVQSPIPIGFFFFVVRPTQSPQKGRGAPGVALFDHDGDGDLDIYVTNGPDADNSLFSSQLEETGQLTFVDVGGPAGVGAFDQDSSGVCFGDIDNDGDEDLYVLGTGEPNRLFENQGDGTFADITATAGVGGDGRHAVACSFADFDGDGLLDVVVGNSYDDWDHRIPVLEIGATSIYGGMEHSYLFLNQGPEGGDGDDGDSDDGDSDDDDGDSDDGPVRFVDASAASGLEVVSNMAGPGLTGAAFTWALATADYDLDGDVDILFADNQGSAPAPIGYLRLYDNDGTGVFTEVTLAADLDVAGGWMGIDFGDFNCDGHLDFFATDLGYTGIAPSRWFLADGDGTFTDSGAGSFGMTPFGWGTSSFDYDNDGDSDIVYHGGIDLLSILMHDNPGVILQNSGACTASFVWDDGALLFDHLERSVQGVAVGDLNRDGFEDIVSVSDSDQLQSGQSQPATVLTGGPTGSPFDAIARFEQAWAGNVNPGFMTYLDNNGRQIVNGTLAVEISSADNGNGWVEVTARGSAGIYSDPSSAGSGVEVNRDGIGAVVFFTPDGGKTSIRPIIGGSSYASQDALAANFGLGAASQGTVEVLWPGGDRNRLYDVASGERIDFPHIPCSFDGEYKNFGQYNSCVMKALNAYKAAGVITAHEKNRLRQSARRAFTESQ